MSKRKRIEGFRLLLTIEQGLTNMAKMDVLLCRRSCPISGFGVPFSRNLTKFDFGAKTYFLAKKILDLTNCAAYLTDNEFQVLIKLEEFVKLNSQVRKLFSISLYMSSFTQTKSNVFSRSNAQATVALLLTLSLETTVPSR